MSRKARNPKWGQPITLSDKYGPDQVSAFDKLTEKLELQPEQYAESTALRAWVQKNRNRRYVPEWLLLKWNLDVDSKFYSSKKSDP